jgi:large subunit ribosomal protein L5
MFHEIDQDRIDRVRGFDITTVVTTAKNDDEGPRTAQGPRFPFHQRGEYSVWD